MQLVHMTTKHMFLFYDVATFYFSLFSMVFFLVITRSNMCTFITLRERSGYSLNLKDK